MSRLDDIRAKFRRACDHQNAGFTLLSEWSNSDPYRVLGRTDDNGWFVIYLEERHPPPVDLALAYADYVHNLRSALDIMVCSLVESQGNPVHKDSGFPVITASRDWRSAVGSQLRGFPAGWVRTVKQYQPFAFGQDFPKHPLYWLHRFDIDSKHRLLIPIVLNRLEFHPSFKFNRAPGDTDWVETQMASVDDPFVDGVVVGRTRARSENEDLRILGLAEEPDEDARLGLAFGAIPSGNPPPVGPMPNLTLFVGTVIEVLAPAF